MIWERISLKQLDLANRAYKEFEVSLSSKLESEAAAQQVFSSKLYGLQDELEAQSVSLQELATKIQWSFLLDAVKSERSPAWQNQ